MESNFYLVIGTVKEMVARFKNRNIGKQDSIACVGKQLKENIICDVVRTGTCIDKPCIWAESSCTGIIS